ncbi:MAG: YjfB family protein [Zoogloeaceae bacterium]|nr:YjfB family protein [Zoogloeaceae bacterium]
MEISSNVGSLASQTSQAPDAVNMTVLRKAIDMQAQAALQLINALPAVSNPSHLGQNVDQIA